MLGIFVIAHILGMVILCRYYAKKYRSRSLKMYILSLSFWQITFPLLFFVSIFLKENSKQIDTSNVFRNDPTIEHIVQCPDISFIDSEMQRLNLSDGKAKDMLLSYRRKLVEHNEKRIWEKREQQEKLEVDVVIQVIRKLNPDILDSVDPSQKQRKPPCETMIVLSANDGGISTHCRCGDIDCRYYIRVGTNLESDLIFNDLKRYFNSFLQRGFGR